MPSFDTLRARAPAVAFGTSGLRALVDDLRPALVSAYARAFVRRVRERVGAVEVCVVGWDLRPSSPAIAAAACAGLAREGVRPVLEGACPTPALALRAGRLGAPALVVTGSHIPFDRNGVKFYAPGGEITKADEIAIAAMDAGDLMEEAESLAASIAAWRGRIADAGAGEAARDYLRRLGDAAGERALEGLRIGVYQHSAVGRDLLTDLLRRLGASVTPLGRSDTFVPIDTEAVSPQDERMAAAWCAQHSLDAVVSTDGDGDRPWICDERGVFLRGDLLGVLCARRLRADAVATPVSSNSVVEACAAFDRVLRTRIGSPFVIEGMETLIGEGRRRVVGYEANGGFLTGTELEIDGVRLPPLPTRDGGLPILLALRLAREENVPLSRLAELLPPCCTASGSLKDVPAAAGGALVARLRDDAAHLADFLAFTGAHATGRDLTDGLRVTLSSGDVVHLRPSGNAPELRCYVEAPTQTQANALLAGALDALVRRLGAPEPGRVN